MKKLYISHKINKAEAGYWLHLLNWLRLLVLSLTRTREKWSSEYFAFIPKEKNKEMYSTINSKTHQTQIQ